jgi:hypothetical protein
MYLMSHLPQAVSLQRISLQSSNSFHRTLNGFDMDLSGLEGNGAEVVKADDTSAICGTSFCGLSLCKKRVETRCSKLNECNHKPAAGVPTLE